MQQISFDLSEEDYMTYARYHFRKSEDARASARRMSIFGLVGFLVYAFANKDDPNYGIQHPALYASRLGVALIMFGALLTVYVSIIRPYTMRGMLKTGMRKVLGATQLEIAREGVQVTNPEGLGRLKWADCRGIVDDTDHIFVLIGPLRAFVVPKRAFDSPGSISAFLDAAKGFYAKAHPEAKKKA